MGLLPSVARLEHFYTDFFSCVQFLGCHNADFTLRASTLTAHGSIGGQKLKAIMLCRQASRWQRPLPNPAAQSWQPWYPPAAALRLNRRYCWRTSAAGCLMRPLQPLCQPAFYRCIHIFHCEVFLLCESYSSCNFAARQGTHPIACTHGESKPCISRF